MGTTTSVISRLKLSHPDIGYDGGASLHTIMSTLLTQLGDNVNSRIFYIPAFAAAQTVTLTHNLGTTMAHNRFMVYRGDYNSMIPLTSASTPMLGDFSFVSTSGFADTKCDITNNSASSYPIVVVLYQDSVSIAPVMAKIQSTTDAPTAGYYFIYPKADGKFYKKGPNGVESVVGGGLTPVKVTFADTPVTVQDGNNYLVDTTGGIVEFFVTGGNSGLLQFAIKNDGSDFTVNKARLKCTSATIYIPDVGVVGVNDYLEIDAPIDSLSFDWDGTRWVGSLTNMKNITTINTYVPGQTPGIVPIDGLPGRTDGQAVASGCVGEIVTATLIGISQTSPVLGTFYDDAGSLPLGPGTWEIKLVAGVVGANTGSISGNTTAILLTAIRTGSTTVSSEVAAGYAAINGVPFGSSVGVSKVVSLTAAETVYKASIRWLANSGSPTVGNIFLDKNTSSFYAIRIA